MTLFATLKIEPIQFALERGSFEPCTIILRSAPQIGWDIYIYISFDLVNGKRQKHQHI